MEMFLDRLDANDHGVFGHLTCEEFNCVTLERHDIYIPVGRYKVSLYQSPAHGLVPLLSGVPNRSWIEIHAGNYEKDSKGCILVGERRDGDAIDTSKATLKVLVAKLQKADEIWLTVR